MGGGGRREEASLRRRRRRRSHLLDDLSSRGSGSSSSSTTSSSSSEGEGEGHGEEGGHRIRPSHVLLSPVGEVPGHRVRRYVGRVNLHFIRESSNVRESGGLSAFLMTLFAEAHSVTKAQVAAMGGNALLGYRILPRESASASRNQSYHVVSVSGDAVMVDRVGA